MSLFTCVAAIPNFVFLYNSLITFDREGAKLLLRAAARRKAPINIFAKLDREICGLIVPLVAW